MQAGGVESEAFAQFDFPFGFPLSTGSDSHCTFEPVQLVEGKERKSQQIFSHLLLKPSAEGILCLMQLLRGQGVFFVIYM